MRTPSLRCTCSFHCPILKEVEEPELLALAHDREKATQIWHRTVSQFTHIWLSGIHRGWLHSIMHRIRLVAQLDKHCVGAPLWLLAQAPVTISKSQNNDGGKTPHKTEPGAAHRLDPSKRTGEARRFSVPLWVGKPWNLAPTDTESKLVRRSYQLTQRDKNAMTEHMCHVADAVTWML